MNSFSFYCIYLLHINLNWVCEMKKLLSVQYRSCFTFSSINTTHTADYTWIKSRPLTVQCLNILTVQSLPCIHSHTEQSSLISVGAWKHSMLLWCFLRCSLLWLEQSVSPQRPRRQTFPLYPQAFQELFVRKNRLIQCLYHHRLIYLSLSFAFLGSCIGKWMQIDSIKCVQWDKRVT